VRVDGGLLVDDADFVPAWVAQTLVPLLQDRQRVARMGSAAASVGSLSGTEHLYELTQHAVRLSRGA
jgi:UDP-N-acetylglucosamine--N-acetylmuramyl-(pentapeptide) pyrophosphoryl-undecaprenol N-acetylglucosamine transferase